MDRSLRALIVEDSEDDGLLLTRELSRTGYDPVIERVDTGPAMAAALEKQDWDLVLCDYTMPRFSPMEALALLKDKAPDVPFIIVSGTIGEEAAVEAMKAGASDYVLKGNLKRLAPAVDRELRDAEVRKERRRAEVALRRSMDEFRALIANALDIITVLGRDGIILYESPSVERVLGYRPEDLVGRPLFEMTHRDDLADFLSAFTYAVDNVGLSRTVEERRRHKDGSWRVLESVIRCVVDEAGASRCVINSRDITDRKSLEDQLRWSQKMEALGRLAGWVCHDFNNLLTGVIGNSELLLQKLKDSDAGFHEARAIAETAQRASELTRQLLAFGRKEVREPVVLNLNEVIEGTRRMHGRLMGEDVEHQILLEPGLMGVRGDRTQIEQMMLNLVVNAREAMPRGGRLTLRTENRILGEGCARSTGSCGKTGRGYVLLTVSDTGVGMSREVVERIFEPFFTTKEKGSGLGLSIVYGIVKQHGGDIYVSSEVGRGTTFRICLPAVEWGVEDGKRRARSNLGVAKGNGETVLVVEDDSTVLELATRYLSGLGYKVIPASRGEEAVLKARRHPARIDLLLMDLVLGDGRGPEIAERVRKHHPDLSILFMSGYTDDGTLGGKILGGKAHFLAKPFTVTALARKVQEALAGEAASLSLPEVESSV